MMRPKSIVLFDYTYLGYLLFAVLNVVVSGGAVASQWLLYAAVIAVSVVLWYLVSRQANVVAKWVIVVLGAFSIISTLMAMSAGVEPMPALSVAVSVVAMSLLAISLLLLFRPEALAWFIEGRTPPAP